MSYRLLPGLFGLFLLLFPAFYWGQDAAQTAWHKGDSLELAGRYPEAATAFLIAAEGYRDAENLVKWLEAWTRTARCYDAAGEGALRSLYADSAYYSAQVHLGPTHAVTAKAAKLRAEGFLSVAAWDSALVYLELANPVLYQTGEWEDWGWGQLLISVQGFSTRNFDQMRHALEALSAEVPEHIPPTGEVYTAALQHKGALAQLTGDYDLALETALQALEIRLKAPNPTRTDSIFLGGDYNNIGAILYRKGDYEKALEYYRRSLAIRQIHPGDWGEGLAETLNNMGHIYLIRNEMEAARNYFTSSLEEHQTGGSSELQIVALRNLSNALEGLGQSDSARICLERVLALEKQDHRPIGMTLEGLAWMEFTAAPTPSALAELQNALAIVKKEFTAEPRIRAEGYTKMAKALMNLDQPQQALPLLDTAMLILLPGQEMPTEEDGTLPENISFQLELMEIFYQRARAKHALFKTSGDPKLQQEASWEIKMATELGDLLRKDYRAEGSKHLLATRSQPIYEFAIQLALESDPTSGIQAAFQYAEKSKSILLLQSIRDSEAKTSVGVPGKVQEAGRQLSLDLGFYTRLANEERLKSNGIDSLKLTLWEEKIFHLSRKKEKLDAYLNQSYPDYFRMRHSSAVIGAEGVQDSILKPGEVLLEFYEGEQHLFCFLLSNDTQQVFKQAKPANYEEMVLSLRHALTDYAYIRRAADSAYETYTQEAYALYQLLLEGPLSALAPTQQNLVIVPDGLMSYLPFEALLTQPAPAGPLNYATLPYLIRSFQIRYAYSATLLGNQHDHPIPDQVGRCLAFAPSSTGSGDMVRAGSFRNSGKQLPGTQLELRAISSSLKGRFLYGEAANEEAFKTLAAEYSVLHLAMHGQADAQNPINSRLLFSDTATSQAEDNSLYAFEIYNLPLKAELVVLSACETGYGKMIAGEGVFSLAREFRNAGAQSVLMTLWKVDDRISAELMESFYAALGKGKDRETALRMAKLSYLENADPLYSHPAYWAGFVTIGQGGPVELVKKGLPIWLWIVLFVGILIGVGGLFSLRKQHTPPSV